MTLVKKLLVFACLCAAVCAAAPSSSLADDAQENANGGKLDFSVFDVEEGKDIAYYRESYDKIEEMLQGVQVRPSDEELERLYAAMRRAYPIVYKRLMNDPDASVSERKHFFYRYVESLVEQNRVAELEEDLKAEKDERRRQKFAVAIFTCNLNAAVAANDKAAVQKAAADLIDRAMNDDEYARQASDLAKTIERADADLGANTIGTIVDRFAASEDETRQKLAKKFAGELRYRALVGNEMKLEGVTLDGKELDWASYRGKAVLVDVFATWCGPCMAELPGMLENYKKYHDAGFDIVSYSIDENLDALKKFEEEKEIPWTTISGFKSASIKDQDGNPKYEDIGEYYGINSIPRMILVGKDGKVVSTVARGENLPQLLRELFPDVK